MPTATIEAQERLIAHHNPRSPIAEAYRQLRTNIQFSSLDRPLRTLVVTSTGANEGKSTTLANLAVTMAQAGNRVVAVDCDLRLPTLHDIFGVKNQVGLTNLVIEGSWDRIPFQETGIENLLVLTSGPLPPNPSEILGSKRMNEVIERLRSEADYVLFDSPPVVVVTDAAVLATRVDGVLLVISAGQTRRELARKAKAILGKVNANLLGVVLTNTKSDAGIQSYYSDRGDGSRKR